MTVNPYDLPPGPERRAALEDGFDGVHPNIAPSDFSEAELAEMQAAEDQLENILAGMKPVATLYDA